MLQKGLKKLKERTGASFLLALALFLICAMVSSVIITAAVSGSSRFFERSDRQQAYLAVSSAAELILKEMEVYAKETYEGEDGAVQNQGYILTAVKKEYTCNNTNNVDASGSPYTFLTEAEARAAFTSGNYTGEIPAEFSYEEQHEDTTYKWSGTGGITRPGTFDKVLQEAAKTVIVPILSGTVAETAKEYSTTFLIEVPDYEDTKVKATLVMRVSFTMDGVVIKEGECSMTITLEPDSGLQSDYAITLEFDSLITQTESKDEENACYHWVSYKADLDGDQAMDTVVEHRQYSYTNYETTTIINWEFSKLIKGKN